MNVLLRLLSAIFNSSDEEVEQIATRGEATVDHLWDRVEARMEQRQNQFANRFQRGQIPNGNGHVIEIAPSKGMVEPSNHSRCELLAMCDDVGLGVPASARTKQALADLLNAPTV